MMIINYLLKGRQVRDTVSYFSKLQVPIFFGGNVSFLSHQELHSTPAPAPSMQSGEARCYAEECKADEVHAFSCDLPQHKV